MIILSLLYTFKFVKSINLMEIIYLMVLLLEL